MQKTKLTLLVILSISFLGCFGQADNNETKKSINKFSDPVIREIHDLADRRDSMALIKFLKNDDLNYQGEALICLGSVQASSLIDSVAQSLNSEMNGIRMAAAFALGQTYNSNASPIIRSALEEDTVKLVKGMLFDALGKTGDEADLKWLADQNTDYQEAEGQAQGILRFSMRAITSPAGNDRVLKIMQEGTSTVGLIYSSYHFGRYTDSVWLSANVSALEKLYRNEADPVVGANLISAIIKGRGKEAGSVISTILSSNADYRDKVNTMTAIAKDTWKDASKSVFKYTESDNPNLAVAAAEAVLRNAGEKDIRSIGKSLNKDLNWRTRAILFRKVLDLVDDDKDLNELISQLKESFNASTNYAERAWLLRALGSIPGQYKFVENHLNSSQAIIRTYAMECLTIMAGHKNYEACKVSFAEKEIDLDKEFLRLFKEGIQSEDIAMVSLSAAIIREPDLPFGKMISDTGFIVEAIKKAESPELIEAKNELLSTLAALKNEKVSLSQGGPAFNHPINWERVMSIPPRQLVGISTSKGDIIVQLNVNWCPGTVGAFIELLESGYYNGKTIHRVVPNFVVQDGCPRGDGWGGPPFTIRSEFTPAPFLEGTLGMASAGKDTEGSQWYFTHTATPHLDGKYSNFGKVVEGIDVVHQLELGDVIKRMVVLQEESK